MLAEVHMRVTVDDVKGWFAGLSDLLERGDDAVRAAVVAGFSDLRVVAPWELHADAADDLCKLDGAMISWYIQAGQYAVPDDCKGLEGVEVSPKGTHYVTHPLEVVRVMLRAGWLFCDAPQARADMSPTELAGLLDYVGKFELEDYDWSKYPHGQPPKDPLDTDRIDEDDVYDDQ